MWADQREIIGPSCHGAIVFFDKTRPETYEAAKQSYAELQSYLDGRVPIFMVATKTDLASSATQPSDDLRTLYPNYYETSAKDNTGLESLLNDLT